MKLVAHLSCRCVTVDANFCRKCGEPLTAENTAPVNESKLSCCDLNAVMREACFLDYEDLSQVS
jgi:hypothetical protein